MPNVVIETPKGQRHVVLLVGTEEANPSDRLYELRALCRAVDLLAEAHTEHDILSSVAASAARLASDLLQESGGILTAGQERALADVVRAWGGDE